MKNVLRPALKSIVTGDWAVTVDHHPTNFGGYGVTVEHHGGEIGTQFSAVILFDEEGATVMLGGQDFRIEDALNRMIDDPDSDMTEFFSWATFDIDKRDKGELEVRIEGGLAYIGFVDDESSLPNLGNMFSVKAESEFAMVEIHHPAQTTNNALGAVFASYEHLELIKPSTGVRTKL